ncbi:MAG: GAF domain-containing protein [Anaerolineales bacterium]|nr:GAF domain-containing protein [Anaerolineales bacterium]MCB8954754.1 GAF domain-containing protein [Ardenticatenales bacterium]
MQDEDHLFRLLFESSHEPTLIARPDKIIAGNQRALATFNCQNQEMLIGHPLAHFAATPPAASLLQTMFGEAQAGQSAQFSWRARCAQGKSFPVRLTFTRLPIPDDLLFRIDVQPEPIDLPPLHYRFIIDNVGDVFARYTPDGVFQYISASSPDVLGYEPVELIGRSIYDFFHPDDLEQVQAAHLSMTLNDEVNRVTYRFRRPDGTFAWMESRGRGIRHPETGKLVEIIATTRDIDVQKKTEATLRYQTESLTAINRIADALYSAQHVDVVVQQALESIASYARATVGVLFAVNETDGTLQLLAQHNLNTPFPPAGERLPLINEIFSVAVQRRAIVTSHDLAHEPHLENFLKHALAQQGAQDLVSIPILFQDQVLGVINLAFATARTTTAAERETLLAIGKTVGVALSNARFMAQLQAEIGEREQLEASIRESLQRQSNQVQLTTWISQEIAHATDLDTLNRRVVDLVQEQFDFYHTQLFRIDPVQGLALLSVGYGPVGDEMLARHHALPLGTGLVGTAAATGRSVLRPDVTDDPQWRPNDLLPQTRGELAVPISFGDTVLGVLDVQSSRAGQLTEEDGIVLEGLCGQIANAIESTRLRQSLEEQVRELRTLQRLMSREGWHSYQTGHGDTPSGYLFDKENVQPLPQTPFAAGNDSPFHDDVPGFIRPITVRGEVIGTMGVTADADTPINAEEQELLDAISRQVAEALETARLLETTQRRAVELETVARLSTAASTILDIDNLLQTVVELTRSNFNLYTTDVILYDEDRNELVLAAASGPNAAAFMKQAMSIPLEHEHSIIARAARTRQGVLVNDVLAQPDFLTHPLLSDTRAELAVPMIASNRLLGILDLQADARDFFTAEDLQVFAVLAAQVAVALQNALLYQEQLETAQKLREVEHLKSQFLANMSHELRTPLNSIIGFSDVILEGLDGPMTPRMEEDVRIIRNSGRHLRELIGEILDMSKIEAGMMQLRYEPVDISNLVQEVIHTSAPLATQRKLELRLEMPAHLSPVQADPTRVRQILLNLLGNAIKFTDEGWVCVQVDDQGDQVIFRVVDTGIGIEEDKIPIVFEEFRQVDGSLTRKSGGTGLGVPISRRLVELHGGQIGVESQINQGSTFWFTLPRQANPKS